MPQDSQVSWTNDSEDYQISFVPGVDRCEETKYSRNKDNPAFIKKKKSSSAYMLPKTTVAGGNAVKSSAEVGSKPISLKDLCPEDKKRVAHLIQELANLQEEKDEVDERFEQERKEFQQQLRDLHNDKQEILREKEAINIKYEKSQEMLQEYQKNITRQQLAAAEEIKLLNQSVKAHYNSHKISPTLKSSVVDDDFSYQTSPRLTTRSLTKKKSPPSSPTAVVGLSSSSAELRAITMEKLDESLARLGIQHNSLFQQRHTDDGDVDVCDNVGGHRMLQPRGRQPSTISEHESNVRGNCSGRRRQLAAQKAALEREQNQLRQLLQEQEDLLDKRQQDLQIYTQHQISDRSNSDHPSGKQMVDGGKLNRSYPRYQQQQTSNNNISCNMSRSLNHQQPQTSNNNISCNMSRSLNHQQPHVPTTTTNRVIGSPRIQSTMLQQSDPLADIHVRSYSAYNNHKSSVADKVKISANRSLRHQTSTPHDVIHPINNSINYQNSLKGETSMIMTSPSRAASKLNDVSTCELPHAYYNKSDVITPPRHHHHVISDDVTVCSDITEIVDAMEDEVVFSPIPNTTTNNRRFMTSQANSDEDEDSELLEDIFFIK